MSPAKVTKKTSTSSGSAPTKSKKRFAETSGISHLLALSSSIVSAQSDLESSRIESKKATIALHQQRKREGEERRKEKKQQATSGPRADAVRAKTKAEIKQQLKRDRREKAKLRKEARRLRVKGTEAEVDEKQQAEDEDEEEQAAETGAKKASNLKKSPSKGTPREKKGPRKSVSFAFE